MKFIWIALHQTAFEQDKSLFINPPLLIYAIPNHLFILETDASDFAVGELLLQDQYNVNEHPVGYFYKKLNSAQRNYDIYDKETVVIIESLDHWKYLLYNSRHVVCIMTDNK